MTSLDAPFSIGVTEEFSVEDFVKFLIVACKSDRSCCKARHNLSSLSNLISACRFSFSINFIFNKKKENLLVSKDRTR